MTCWKCNSLKLFSAQSMQMLMWTCGIALFYMLFNCPLFALSVSVCTCLGLHLCITVIYLSISLEVTGSVFLFLLFLLIFHLTCPSFSSLWISLTCFLYLGFFFQLSLLCQLEDRYTVLYLASSVTTDNSETSCISNCFLVKEYKSPLSTFFLEILWEGMNGMATAMLMAIIVETGRSP